MLFFVKMGIFSDEKYVCNNLPCGADTVTVTGGGGSTGAGGADRAGTGGGGTTRSEATGA